jgi:hypothetical protein
MKKLALALWALVVAAAPLAAGQGGDCREWDGLSHKMHWVQDVDANDHTSMIVSLGRVALADDFECTATGPVRDIHIWGSFLNNVLPGGGSDSPTLELTIYADVPATEERGSRPGKPLWTRIFRPGQYTTRQGYSGANWYDSESGNLNLDHSADLVQYDFCIKEEPFVQKAGTIYWLAVKDLSANPQDYTFGWRITEAQWRWNDDAVYIENERWIAMNYPAGLRHDGQTLDLAFGITADDKLPEYDLGDAPDSSNSFPGVTMVAYPSGVLGKFPTDYQVGSPPYGPRHRYPRDRFFLGPRVSLEAEADIGPDEDGITNLDPMNDAVNRDGADDGWEVTPALGASTFDVNDFNLVSFPGSSEDKETIVYSVTCTSTQATRSYVNLWLDLNRDGDWDDVLSGPDGAAEPEWAVQNQELSLPAPGYYTFTSPPFNCPHLVTEGGDPLWVRITIAEKQHLPTILTPGAGPAEGYEYGETEDYYIRPESGPTAVKYDWGDAPEIAAVGGYPTLRASNGARHQIGGPWLGDDSDMPDSELDGQPRLEGVSWWPDGVPRPTESSLGDDADFYPPPPRRPDPNALYDDEDGVRIPPLVPGQLASATIQVNGGGGVVQGWIDFNRDWIWQAAESVFNGFLPNGIHVVPFSVPNSAVVGQTFARFRISRQGGLGPVGAAPDGEVEDHEVSIGSPPTEGKTWCQPPDLTPHGIDIRMDNDDNQSRALADDFECRSYGERLTHIRFWGSWKDDHNGKIQRLRIRIHPDDPVGLGGADKNNEYSRPGPEILWEKEFVTDQFRQNLYFTVDLGDGEWWWDPASETAIPGGDTRVWQIDLDIRPDEAFVQEGTPDHPRIYWLAIEAETADGEFGWKTRQWPEHFVDDAVWHVGPGLPRRWHELRYPLGHPYYDEEPNSIDLAFCLTFSADTPSPPTILPEAVTQCPAVETTCPAVLTTCPPVQTQCPSTQTKCPAAVTQCPPQATTCPVAETQCPPVQTKCPPVATSCPAEQTKCPPVQTYCPAEQTKCPAYPTRCPESPTKCPPTKTQCPVVETQCPATPTNCVIVYTECPALQTRCPPVETKCPATTTQCPLVSTSCPATATRCPPAATLCPPTMTQCLRLLTRCPICLLTGPNLDLAEESNDLLGPGCPVVETDCPGVSEYLVTAMAEQQEKPG